MWANQAQYAPGASQAPHGGWNVASGPPAQPPHTSTPETHTQLSGTQSQSSAWAAASAALQSQTSHNSAAAANVVQNPAAANMQAYPSQSLSYAAATTPYGYPTQQTPQQQYYGTYNPAAYNNYYYQNYVNPSANPSVSPQQRAQYAAAAATAQAYYGQSQQTAPVATPPPPPPPPPRPPQQTMPSYAAVTGGAGETSNAGARPGGNTLGNAWAWGTGKSTTTLGTTIPTPTPTEQRASVKFSMKHKPTSTRTRHNGAFGSHDDVDDGNGASAFVTAPPPPPPPPPKAAGAAEASGQWPASLKHYVNRVFTACRNDTERNHAELHLKEIILRRTEAGTLHTADWSREPLPSANPIYDPTEELAKRASLTAKQRKLADRLSSVEEKKNKKRKDRFSVDSDESTLAQRADRFKERKTGGKGKRRPHPTDDAVQYTLGPVRGKSQEVFKSFFRLTTKADPTTVRPPHVLVESLRAVQEKWVQNEDYKWTCDQLKSIRQDLTVQCVRDDFTVKVYETHARIALERGDIMEFNQCQVQLRSLYDDGQNGCVTEFAGYRLLYNIYTRNTDEQMAALSELNVPGSRINARAANIQHALDVRSSQATGNFVRFFNLFRDAPLMGGYLMDFFVKRERNKALLQITHAFRPSVEVKTVEKWLAFENTGACIEFLNDLDVVFAGVKGAASVEQDVDALIDCKTTYPLLQAAARASRGVASWAQ